MVIITAWQMIQSTKYFRSHGYNFYEIYQIILVLICNTYNWASVHFFDPFYWNRVTLIDLFYWIARVVGVDLLVHRSFLETLMIFKSVLSLLKYQTIYYHSYQNRCSRMGTDQKLRDKVIDGHIRMVWMVSAKWQNLFDDNKLPHSYI